MIGVSEELREWLDDVEGRVKIALASESDNLGREVTFEEVEEAADRFRQLDWPAVKRKVEELSGACDWFLQQIQENGWADGADILRRFQSALRAPGGEDRS